LLSKAVYARIIDAIPFNVHRKEQRMPANDLNFRSSRKDEKSSFRSARGFSMVEILIVMFVLAILTVLAVYSWQRFVKNNNLRSAARVIVSDIAQYRERSMAENTAYTITFDVAGNSYTISPGNITKPLSIAGPGLTFQSVNFSGVTANKISMQTRGLLNNGTIVLKNDRNSIATITVNTAGRTYVQFTIQ
jgi:prepilin-type N-terminal cleavage/methylation domain-containing protein